MSHPENLFIIAIVSVSPRKAITGIVINGGNNPRVSTIAVQARGTMIVSWTRLLTMFTTKSITMEIKSPTLLKNSSILTPYLLYFGSRFGPFAEFVFRGRAPLPFA